MKTELYFIFLLGLLSACSKFQTHTKSHLFSEKICDGRIVEAWWNNWPKFTNHTNPEKASIINADLLTVGPNSHDEGVGSFFRRLLLTSSSQQMQKAEDLGLRYLSWIEGLGDSRTFIMAGPTIINGRPNVKANYWSWSQLGPDANSTAGQVVWSGLSSFVNNPPWMGEFGWNSSTLSNFSPTYPNGELALGYFEGPHDPTSSRFYDAIGSKDIFGNLRVNASKLSEPQAGFIEFVDSSGNRTYSGDMMIGKDPGSDWWVEYDIIAAKDFIDYGSSGFWVDNFSGFDSFGTIPLKVAFGEWSVKGFNKYLLENGLINSAEAESFDIRKYLIEKFNSDFPNSDSKNFSNFNWRSQKWLNDRIWRAYISYKSKLSTRYLKKFYETVKEYSRSINGDADDILISGNDIPTLTFGAHIKGLMDMVSTEYSPGWALDVGSLGRGLPPDGGASGFYALATSFARSRHANIWYYLEGPYQKYSSNNNLATLLGYEALANNVILNSGASNHRIAGTDQSAKKINDSIEILKPHFGWRDRFAEVALLYSSQTQLANFTPGGAFDFENQSHHQGFYGWGELLEDHHISYKAIPDFKLELNELKNIKVLILPNVSHISGSYLTSTITPFLENGGRLIITGESSGEYSDRNQNLKNHGKSLFNDLKNSKFSHQIEIINENLGQSYFKNINQSQISIQALGLLSRFKVNPIINNSVNNLLTVPHRDHCTDNFFIDILNKNIHLESDQMVATDHLELEINLPEYLRSLEVDINLFRSNDLSLTNVETQRVSADRIRVKIPSFDMYTSIIFKKGKGVSKAPPENPPEGPTASVTYDGGIGYYGKAKGENKVYFALFANNEKFNSSDNSLSLDCKNPIGSDIIANCTSSSTGFCKITYESTEQINFKMESLYNLSCDLKIITSNKKLSTNGIKTGKSIKQGLLNSTNRSELNFYQWNWYYNNLPGKLIWELPSPDDPKLKEFMPSRVFDSNGLYDTTQNMTLDEWCYAVKEARILCDSPLRN